MVRDDCPECVHTKTACQAHSACLRWSWIHSYTVMLFAAYHVTPVQLGKNRMAMKNDSTHKAISLDPCQCIGIAGRQHLEAIHINPKIMHQPIG
ncbi:hypothetical protein [Xylella fastidiosa]|uniref:hypothetical protein n=1 Tax=Xylella fastidiosa TaxID=2371 RepID=UPI000FFE7596|nr:hypothetical protein [Xylella fastidiosa subsp. multiplex]TVS39190.1 hypothetical protein E2N95_02010 [Xylella fastidiosa subsp. multiplex]TVS44865.1 hypothetical protein E2E25_03620 [Xylella fastidiosa subsp. multiplex]TVS45930.1 hypothetical protein E2N96_02010 [Xylella fastidiosa subsp. multiplex]